MYYQDVTCGNHITGGTIEHNEVFGNRYHGICLATGVNPKLKGEHYIAMLHCYHDN